MKENEKRVSIRLRKATKNKVSNLTDDKRVPLNDLKTTHFWFNGDCFYGLFIPHI